jgi:tRNA pseudouridine55 synthase
VAAPSILLCDKPAGITSHDLVAQVRRERGGKVGHAGTLDPFATGLLLVLLGPATRLQQYLMPLPKTYLATARLGWRSTTGDPDGDLTETGRVPKDLTLPTGTVRQRLPMTSAARVGGERLYKKAHRGEEVATPEREVRVYRADLIDSDSERARYEIECAAGTYVRTLIEELEDAYCSELRRTRIGDLSVDDAGAELSPAEALAFMTARELTDAEATDARHGRLIAAGDAPTAEAAEALTDGPVRLMHEGSLVAIAHVQDNALRPKVVLPA